MHLPGSDVHIDAVETTNESINGNGTGIEVHLAAADGIGYWLAFESSDREKICTWWPF